MCPAPEHPAPAPPTNTTKSRSDSTPDALMTLTLLIFQKILDVKRYTSGNASDPGLVVPYSLAHFPSPPSPLCPYLSLSRIPSLLIHSGRSIGLSEGWWRVTWLRALSVHYNMQHPRVGWLVIAWGQF